MTDKTDWVLKTLFVVVIFIALISTGYSTLTETTTDTDTIESFAIPTTITSYVTLTGNDAISINNVTNSTTAPIQLLSAGNYTFYEGNNTLMILDNSSYTGAVVVNYVDRPSGYMSGTNSTLVFLVLLLFAIGFLVTMSKGVNKGGR